MTMEQEDATSSQEITRQTFQKVLSRYSDLIEELSKHEKPSKASALAPRLSKLDQWRLNELPSIVQQRKTKPSKEAWLEKDEVEKLIHWKLYVHDD